MVAIEEVVDCSWFVSPTGTVIVRLKIKMEEVKHIKHSRHLRCHAAAPIAVDIEEVASFPGSHS